jgi:orotate phosphoribosyltransferase
MDIRVDIGKLLKRSHLALVVLGGVLLLVAAIGGLPIGSPTLTIWKPIDPVWRYVLAGVSLVVMAIGLLLIWREYSRRSPRIEDEKGPVDQASIRLVDRPTDPKNAIVRVIKTASELGAVFTFPNGHDDFVEALAESGCLLEGHFRLVSGKHSARFIRLRSILDNTASRASFVDKMIASVRTIQFTTIIGPAGTTGGALAEDIGRTLGVGVRTFPAAYNKRCLDISAERAKELVSEKCLYIDDLVTTGDGIIAAVESLSEREIPVAAVAVGFVRDRAAGVKLEEELAARRISFVFLGYAALAAFTWDEAHCKLCRLVRSQDIN